MNHSYSSINTSELIEISSEQQILVELNQRQTDFPQKPVIHQLFEAQVKKTPNQIAVVFEEQQFTYAELNHKVNQLAHYLQKLGVQAEVVVGICLERSPEFIVSILAILKAGGAYLPLDPSLGKAALQFRCEDAQALVLIKDQEHSQKFNNIIEVNLKSDWEIITQESIKNPIENFQPENLAYVIYTSGSTGRPKGVAIEHRQLVNYLDGILPKLELPANSSYAIVSTFAADLGNTVIFPSLCTGGCLHIVSWERATDPMALAAYFRLHSIDCLKIVPSQLSALLSSECMEILPRQLLILGGEATDGKLIDKIQNNSSCRILNHYVRRKLLLG